MVITNMGLRIPSGAPFTPIPKGQGKLISQVMQTLDFERMLLRGQRYP